MHPTQVIRSGTVRRSTGAAAAGQIRLELGATRRQVLKGAAAGSIALALPVSGCATIAAISGAISLLRAAYEVMQTVAADTEVVNESGRDVSVAIDWTLGLVGDVAEDPDSPGGSVATVTTIVAVVTQVFELVVDAVVTGSLPELLSDLAGLFVIIGSIDGVDVIWSDLFEITEPAAGD